jgi:hypothetical protein
MEKHMTNHHNVLEGDTTLTLGTLPTHSRNGEYALATGASATGRLFLLHNIYSPVGRRVLWKAGLTPGMRVADFGCGVGAVTSMLADIVGPTGSVILESMPMGHNSSRRAKFAQAEVDEMSDF